MLIFYIMVREKTKEKIREKTIFQMSIFPVKNLVIKHA